MTIDEAISHEERIVEINKLIGEVSDCEPTNAIAYHRQLVELLKELKRLREQTRWIPVSDGLPEIKQHILLSCYGRVIYGRMIDESGNSGYPIFEICDSVSEKRPIVLETTVHSKYTVSRITAWMPLPEPFKAESEDKE